MPSVRWFSAALRDMQRLYRFLTPKNPDAARRVVKAIRQGVQVLKRQSAIGRHIEDMPDPFREWLIDFGSSGYVVRYRVDTDGLTVLAVWHQRETDFP